MEIMIKCLFYTSDFFKVWCMWWYIYIIVIIDFFIQICVCALYSVFYMRQAFDGDFIYICLGDFVLSRSVMSNSLQPHGL